MRAVSFSNIVKYNNEPVSVSCLLLFAHSPFFPDADRNNSKHLGNRCSCDLCTKRNFRVLLQSLSTKYKYAYQLHNLDTNAPPTFLASELEYSPLSTKPLAWLNLSHLEKANVFVMVKTSAMAR